MNTADLSAEDALLIALNASVRLVQHHHEVCPGCRLGMHCPIYKTLRKESDALLDAACRAMQEGAK